MTNDVEFCKTCFHPKRTHYALTELGVCSEAGCTCQGWELGEIRVTSLTGGAKGTKAAQFSLVPPYPLTLLAKLYNFGVAKYAAHNWRKGYDWSKSYDAAMRHMTQFWEGEDIDEETGTPHVICAVFHMFALAQFMKDFPEYDDRFKVAEKAQTLKDILKNERTTYELGIQDIDLKFPTGNEVAGVDFDIEDFGGVGLLNEAENVNAVSFDDELAKTLYESQDGIYRQQTWEELKQVSVDNEVAKAVYANYMVMARSALKAGYFKSTIQVFRPDE